MKSKWIGALIGGITGFILSFTNIIGIPIWFFGKKFFSYPISSFIMSLGCFDSCTITFFWLRIILTSIIFSLIGILISLIRFRKLKIKRVIVSLFFIFILIQISANINAQEDISNPIQNVSVIIDSPSVIRSGNELILRVIIENLNIDDYITLENIDIFNINKKSIESYNKIKVISPIGEEAERLKKIEDSCFYYGNCTLEISMEYYEKTMKVKKEILTQ